MKKKFLEQLEIPSGISCEFAGKNLKCRKDSVELSKLIDVPSIAVKVEGSKISIGCESGNKRDYKTIKSYVAHVKNMFAGLDKEFVYHLEFCNVHFPMTLKVEGDKLVINNFLGEKTPRFARILPGVKVEIKSPKITLTSTSKDAAGQTAANFEKATKIRNRDRRIFQDGIFIVERPGGAK